MVCTAVTVAVTVGTLTTATGVTPTLAGGVEATGGISETTDVVEVWEVLGAGLVLGSGLELRVFEGDMFWVETGSVTTVAALLAAVEAGAAAAPPD